MSALVFPRRVTSTPFTVTVTSASASTPAWVQTIGLGEFATIPATPTLSPWTSTGYSHVISVLDNCDNGWSWNDHYGPGGAMLFVGGGHTAHEFPYSWIFDGLKTEDGLPGWRAGNLTPPGGIPPLPELYNTYAPFRYIDGSEFSSVQANMPADAIKYGSSGNWYKRGNEVAYGYPAGSFIEYGECGTGFPAGWHQYQGMYPLAPGELGTGAKGGWACSHKHSVTSASGIWSPWGHIFDGATTLWARQPFRFPPDSGGAVVISNNGAYNRSCVIDGFAYVAASNEASVTGMVRTNLTTGVHTVLRMANAALADGGCGFCGVPGTYIIASLKNVTTASYGNSAQAEWRLRIINMDPALPYTSRSTSFINIDPETPNPLALPGYGGCGDMTLGHQTAQTWWIPEVGKFASFGAQRLTNVNNGYGDWPFGIIWHTPPNPPEEGIATWFTGLWRIELEPLTAVDARAQNKENRGAGSIKNPDGSVITSHLQYRHTWYSPKLRCFIHMPRMSQGNIFFFRSRKIP